MNEIPQGATTSKLYVGTNTVGAEAWLGIGDKDGNAWWLGRDHKQRR